MKRIAWVWVVAALLPAAGVEAEEGARVMTLVDMLEVPTLSSPRLFVRRYCSAEHLREPLQNSLDNPQEN